VANQKVKSPVKVVNDAEVPTEILASSIVEIAQGIRKLRSGKLNDRALFLLIQDACKVNIGLATIREVFDAIGDLERQFVRRVVK
jgi:hypothetical protein